MTSLAPADTARESPDHLYELGLTTEAMGFHTAAIEALRDCTEQAPGHAAAWRKLAELLRLGNEVEPALAAEAASVKAARASPERPAHGDAGAPGPPEKAERKLLAMLENTPPEKAVQVLRDRLVADPRDAAAMRLLARLELMNDDTATAWQLLERALDLCPGYIGAREDYAESLLARRFKAVVAARETRRLLDYAPRNERYRRLHAFAMLFTGNLDAVDRSAGRAVARPSAREVTY